MKSKVDNPAHVPGQFHYATESFLNALQSNQSFSKTFFYTETCESAVKLMIQHGNKNNRNFFRFGWSHQELSFAIRDIVIGGCIYTHINFPL